MAYHHRNTTVCGGIVPSTALITYHTFVNPGWFAGVPLGGMPLMTALLLYGGYHYDKAIFNGALLGYLAFFLAL